MLYHYIIPQYRLLSSSILCSITRGNCLAVSSTAELSLCKCTRVSQASRLTINCVRTFGGVSTLEMVAVCDRNVSHLTTFLDEVLR